MTVEFSPRSIADLQEILEFVARFNPQAAVRLIDGLEERCMKLAEFPAVGTRRDDLSRGMRVLSHGSYAIYFVQKTDDVVLIARVLHSARDVKPIDFRPSL
jgi:toxin ParE1/3/4